MIVGLSEGERFLVAAESACDCGHSVDVWARVSNQGPDPLMWESAAANGSRAASPLPAGEVVDSFTGSHWIWSLGRSTVEIVNHLG